MLSRGWTPSGATWLAEPVGVSLSDWSATPTCPLLGLDGLHDLNGLGGFDGLDVLVGFDDLSVHVGFDDLSVRDDLEVV